MKIVITHSYFLRFDTKQWQIGRPYPPLGTLYAASSLIGANHDVSFIDTMFYQSPGEIAAALDPQPDLFVIYDDGFNYLTKMCLTNMRDAAFAMIGLAASPRTKVIVSSSDSTDHYQQYLEAGADFILLGEGEATLLELVQAIGTNRTDFSNIAGLAFKDNGYPIKTSKRSVIRNLDLLPLPAWSLLNVEPYKELWKKNAGYFSINVGTTRGCPYKCNWCAKPIYGNRYNARTPANVLHELKMLKDTFGLDHVWFCDDIFGLKPGWVEEFADVVEDEKLKFRFKIQSRADLLANETYVKALARAGCEEVWMGAESGSQKILDAMDKGIQVNQIKVATELLKANNIKPCFFIQFGYLGETRDDIDLTIKMINRLLPHEIGISVSYPLPGTVFYEKVKTQLHKKSNWTDSDEMVLMFRNTYSPSYYKQLHRYVHKNYRKHLAIENLRALVKTPLRATRKMTRKAFSFFYLLPAVYLSGLALRKLEKK
ncbi:B12-binding domain-containing radical SAM protein [Flavitalea sp.]|nr:radical SAM protein [Flavitalea sp.]